MTKKLDKIFFEQNTLRVAKLLLGKRIVRMYRGKRLSGVIVETEAYSGFDDLASHASRKKTARNEVMFGEAGVAYVYLIYGMYHCFNIVTESRNFPSAVLVRAIDTENEQDNTNGPGKLCNYLHIGKALNKEDLTRSSRIWIEDVGSKVSDGQIVCAPRVGVSYAKHCADWPRRFYISSNKAVSKL